MDLMTESVDLRGGPQLICRIGHEPDTLGQSGEFYLTIYNGLGLFSLGFVTLADLRPC